VCVEGDEEADARIRGLRRYTAKDWEEESERWTKLLY
jgi:hypothetical protein